MFFRCSQHAKCKRFQTFPLHFSNSQVIRLDQTFHNLPKNVLWSCLARLIFFGMLLTSLKFASTVLSWPYPKNISLILRFWGVLWSVCSKSEVCYESEVLYEKKSYLKCLCCMLLCSCEFKFFGKLGIQENFKKLLPNAKQGVIE